MNGSLRRVFSMILAVLLLFAFCVPASASSVRSSAPSGQNDPVNYIVVIDNSASTYAVSNGNVLPTDEKQLRYAACRYLIDEASLNPSARIGMILFSGKDATDRFGLYDVSAPEVQSIILGNLNNPLTYKNHNSQTNITNALEQAMDMAETSGNGAKTAIILITDGANTEVSDQTSNDAAKKIKDKGYSFYTIALTNDKNYNDTFLGVIKRISVAGGGTSVGNGATNMFEADAEGLLDSIQRIISDVSGNGNAVVHKMTPFDYDLKVQAELDSEVIFISFNSYEKQFITNVTVTDPNGQPHIFMDGGSWRTMQDGNIQITEDATYFKIEITEPDVGYWKLHSESTQTMQIGIRDIQSVNLRLAAGNIIGTVYVGDTKAVEAYFERYINGYYQTVNTIYHYDISNAEIIVTQPDSRVLNYRMNKNAGSFSYDIPFNQPGVWNLEFRADSIYANTQAVTSVNVLPAPTAVPFTPTPSPSPTPTPVPVGNMAITIDPRQTADPAGKCDWYIPKNAASFDISGSFTGEFSSHKITIKDEHNVTVNEISGDRLTQDVSRLNKGIKYTALYTVVDKTGKSNDVTTTFKLYPDPTVITGFTVSCDNIYGNGAGGVILTDGSKAELTWNAQNPGDITDIQVLDNQNNPIGSYKFNVNKRSFDIKLTEGVTTTVNVIPVPQYGTANDGRQYQVTLQLTPKVFSAKEKFMSFMWPKGAIILGSVIAAAALAFVIIRACQPKLAGYMIMKVEMTDNDGNMMEPDVFKLDLNGCLAKKKLIKLKPYKKECAGKTYFETIGKIIANYHVADGRGCISADPDGNDPDAPKYQSGFHVLQLNTPSYENLFIVSDSDMAKFELSDSNGTYRCFVRYSKSDANMYL